MRSRLPALAAFCAVMGVAALAPAAAQGIEFGPKAEDRPTKPLVKKPAQKATAAKTGKIETGNVEAEAAPKAVTNTAKTKAPEPQEPVAVATPVTKIVPAAPQVTAPAAPATPEATPPPAETAATPSVERAAPLPTTAVAPPSPAAVATPAPPTPLVKAATLVIPPPRGDPSTTSLPPKPAPANCRTEGSFDAWLAAFRKEAAAEGISKAAIAKVLDGVSMDPGVISRDRRQGIFLLSFTEFVAKLASAGRISAAKANIKKNQDAFARVAKEYGVPASVITGFWALESDFGIGMGKLPILNSIATLAYDCRRGPMFRDELKAVIKIVERDYNNDGKANLFSDDTDIIGSTANFMHNLGWLPNQPWLEEVKVTGDLPWDQAELGVQHPRSKWAEWGVTKVNGSALDADDMPASLMLPMGRRGTAFLAYPNFHIYLKWNQSLNYAITAAYLATRIDGAPALQKGPGDIPVLSVDEAKELQRQLKKRGFDVGEVDGRIGSSTRSAVKQMQIKYNLPPDSYPTPELLSALSGG
jgi:membrane-bound lytic murein transglycosylase B